MSIVIYLYSYNYLLLYMSILYTFIQLFEYCYISIFNYLSILKYYYSYNYLLLYIYSPCDL